MYQKQLKITFIIIIKKHFEQKMEIKKQKSSLNKTKAKEDVENICAKFMEQNIFAEDSKRMNSYESFPKFDEKTLST